MTDDQNKSKKIEDEVEIKNQGEDTELGRTKKERDDYLDGWKRAKADLINYKKEEVQRVEGFMKFANEGMVREFLSVLDSFDLGLATLPESDPGRKGMEMIRAQCLEILKRYGLEMIGTSIGEPFDSATEEAVGEIESSLPPHTVVHVVGRGYRLNGKVLRPTQVTVSKGQSI